MDDVATAPTPATAGTTKTVADNSADLPDNIGAPAVADNIGAPAAPLIPDRPAYLYAVSDCRGFIGAFYTMGLAVEGVVRKYAPTPFLVQRFPIAPGPFDRVWCVIRRGDDSIAYMSNDKAEATRVQRLYAAVGLVYEDDVSYWEQPAGAIIPPARERLESLARAHLMYAPDAVADAEKKYAERDLARVEAMMGPNPDGPIARMLREMELITIMDCVEPIPLERYTDAEHGSGSDTPADSADTPADSADTVVNIEQNGMEQNGMEQNGVEQNGVEQNGVEQNGVE